MSERPWSPQYRVLGRALVMLVGSERPILFTTRRVGAKQPRRVVEHILCGLQQRYPGPPESTLSEEAAWLKGLRARNIACWGAH